MDSRGAGAVDVEQSALELKPRVTTPNGSFGSKAEVTAATQRRRIITQKQT
jgi:hypothetical protein